MGTQFEPNHKVNLGGGEGLQMIEVPGFGC